LVIVEAVRDALKDRLHEVKWMSASTREEAIKKMEQFRKWSFLDIYIIICNSNILIIISIGVKIGFPDKWIDYSSLNITYNDHIGNVIASRVFNFNLELSRINKETDRSRWFMTPQTVNAYYHPSLNEIVFPAAILQAPFFDPEADVSIRFGSMGAVVGHEMTHGFDDQGRKYDWNGNLRDWWAEGDGDEYERRAQTMIKQAGNFEVYGMKLNGKLTCGENIADIGGVKLSLRALQKYLKNNPDENISINGFTPAQRLFLAWSQCWRENAKKERSIQLLTIDPHAPNEFRCNSALSNVPEFFSSFNIKSGDPMYRAEDERVDIW